jgi:7,8-dihydroneopterin aldolase/epimerase/oxygenase
MSSIMNIELKGLRFFATHGWHEEEAFTGNEFEVAITASFIPTDAVITAIDQTISYVDIYTIAKEVFAVREKLLETVAMKMAEKIHNSFPQVKKVQISITKLSAPITSFIGSVGISYTKEFK